jgi:DHA2 family multidrug resistance protein
LKRFATLADVKPGWGGAIGIAACATILDDRTNLHFLYLVEHLNPTNSGKQGLIHGVTIRFAAGHGGDLLHGHATALKQLWPVTCREARVQTFADAFLAMAVCLAIAL